MTGYSTNNIESYRIASTSQGVPKSVQAWKSAKTATPTPLAHQQISNNLEKAATGKVGSFDLELDNAMAYAASDKPSVVNNTKQTEAFQFADVVDIINPLQHLPVVNMVYRGLTGDTINPMSQIIGSAIYGGPVGAVTGTINAVAQVQTGKDFGDHMLGFAGLTNKQPKSVPTPLMGFAGLEQKEEYKGDMNDPAARLDHAARTLIRTKSPAALEELPGNTLSFVNLADPGRAYYRDEAAEGRTAGKMLVRATDEDFQRVWNEKRRNPINEIPPEKVNLDQLPQWETISTLTLSAMPSRKSIH